MKDERHVMAAMVGKSLVINILTKRLASSGIRVVVTFERMLPSA